METKPEWDEAGRLYLGVLGVPTSGKTPALNLVVKPYRFLQNLEMQRFAAALAARGHVVTVRHSLGADITAACGQLTRVVQTGRPMAPTGQNPARPV